MQTIVNPERKDWSVLLQRPYDDNSAVLNSVNNIISRVKTDGDVALYQFAKEFDHVII